MIVKNSKSFTLNSSSTKVLILIFTGGLEAFGSIKFEVDIEAI